jgi:hypothetical protein
VGQQSNACLAASQSNEILNGGDSQMVKEVHGAVRLYWISLHAECANRRIGRRGRPSTSPGAHPNAFCSEKALVDRPGNNFSLGRKQYQGGTGMKRAPTKG